MEGAHKSAILDDLRQRVRGIERGAASREGRRTLPFDIEMIDARLPDGGLALGVLHQIEGGGPDLAHGAAAAVFAAGVLARLSGPVLWCLGWRDLFAPSLAQAGLHPDRVIYVEAGSDQSVLLIMEEGLRHRGLAGIVGEISRLPLAASRRLQLAAEGSGVTAFALRRWRKPAAAGETIEPTAAMTRWRVTAFPAAPLPVAGLGRPRWRLELLRCRGGEAHSWMVEGCDAQGRLAVPADMADRPAATAGRLSAVA